jgi:hypothetical protein
MYIVHHTAELPLVQPHVYSAPLLSCVQCGLVNIVQTEQHIVLSTLQAHSNVCCRHSAAMWM